MGTDGPLVQQDWPAQARPGWNKEGPLVAPIPVHAKDVQRTPSTLDLSNTTTSGLDASTTLPGLIKKNTEVLRQNGNVRDNVSKVTPSPRSGYLPVNYQTSGDEKSSGSLPHRPSSDKSASSSTSTPQGQRAQSSTAPRPNGQSPVPRSSPTSSLQKVSAGPAVSSSDRHAVSNLSKSPNSPAAFNPMTNSISGNNPADLMMQNPAPPHTTVDILTDPTEIDRMVDWQPQSVHLDPGAAGQLKALVTREEYVPVRIAREKIKQMAAEMARTKMRHLQAIEKVEDHYNKMKTQAESKVKDYIATLTAKHAEEMQRMQKAYTAKVKTVRAHVLGNVDIEVEKARRRVERLHEEIREKQSIAEVKIEHERSLFEEQKVAVMAEIGIEKEAAIEKQKEAEEKLAKAIEDNQKALDEHAAALRKHEDDMQAQLLQKVKELKEKYAAEAVTKDREREVMFAKLEGENNLKASVRTSELKMERERVQKEAASAKDMVVKAEKTLGKVQKRQGRVALQIRELLTMTTIDHEHRLSEEREPLRQTINSLQQQVKEKEEAILQLEQRVVEKTTEAEQASKDIAVATSSTQDALRQAEEKLKELESEKEAIFTEKAAMAAAHADFEVTALSKLEKHEHIKSLYMAAQHNADAVTEKLSASEALRASFEKDLATRDAAWQQRWGVLMCTLRARDVEMAKLEALRMSSSQKELVAMQSQVKDKIAEIEGNLRQGVEDIFVQRSRIDGEVASRVQKLHEAETELADLQRRLAESPASSPATRELAQKSTESETLVKAARSKVDQMDAQVREAAQQLLGNVQSFSKSMETAEAGCAAKLQELNEKIKRAEEKLASAESQAEAADLRMEKLEEEHESPKTNSSQPERLEELESAKNEAEQRKGSVLAVESTLKELKTERKNVVARALTDAAKATQEFSEKDCSFVEKQAAAIVNQTQAWADYTTALREQEAVHGKLALASEADSAETVELKSKLQEHNEKVHAHHASHLGLRRAISEQQLSEESSLELHREHLFHSYILREITKATDGRSAAASGLFEAGALSSDRSRQIVKVADPKLEEKYNKVAAEKKALVTQLSELTQALDDLKAKQSADETAMTAESGVKAREAAAAAQKEIAEIKAKAREKEKELKKELKKLHHTAEKAGAISGELQELKKQNETLQAESAELKANIAQSETRVVELQQLAGESEAIKGQLVALKSEHKHLVAAHADADELYKKEAALRKKYFNTIQDLKGNIRVMVRCRPMNSIEQQNGSIEVVSFQDEYSIAIQNMESKKKVKKEFVFDQVFTPTSTQEQVWEESKHFVQSAIDGYNTCIFAYGQTGSGKTFTMEGSSSMPGVTPRCIAELYEILEASKKKITYSVSCYMLELYTDNLYDLLLDKKGFKDKKEYPSLDIKKDAKGMVIVAGTTISTADSREMLASAYTRGCQQRHTRATGMNESSSRSHLVFSILVETVDKATGKTSTGKLSLVDLAGSERMDKTGIKDEAGQKEAKSINKSLTALGAVISALCTNESHVPYRNNKLTLLMSDSLGGNAKTMMIAAVSPASYNQDESTNTLAYAARTKTIQNDASKNQESKEVARLKTIIQKLKEGETVDEEVG